MIDRWLEEDEEVIVHPRDPHARVEALASSRRVRVSLGGSVAWSYAAPFRAVERVAGRIAFYNEVVDITVDGAEQIRPRSPFSTAANRPTP